MRYLALVKEEREKLLSRLEEMPAFLEAAFGRVSAAEAVLPGPEGTFSPVEQCWHLADLEREGFGARIVRLLSEEEPVLPDFDGLRVAQERGYRRRSLADGLRAFRVAREGTLAMLRSIRARPEWERSGRQEGVGRVALCDLPAMIAEHDASHRAEIEAWMREHAGA